MENKPTSIKVKYFSSEVNDINKVLTVTDWIKLGRRNEKRQALVNDFIEAIDEDIANQLYNSNKWNQVD